MTATKTSSASQTSRNTTKSSSTTTAPSKKHGTPEFRIVKDDVSGPSDGQKVVMRGVLAGKTGRADLFKGLQVMYRFAMKRDTMEPTDFSGELVLAEGDSTPQAKVWRSQSDKGPKCEILVKRTFAEQTKMAFDSGLGREEDDDPNDTCKLTEKKVEPRFDDKFTHKPSYKIDEAAKSMEVTFPYLQDGKDEYNTDISFNSAMVWFVEFTSKAFKRSDDLKELTFVGLIGDEEPGLKVTVSRSEFENKLVNVQETVAGYAKVTFAKLGMHKIDDKGAFKAQEKNATEVYTTALGFLPKEHVLISPKLKKAK